MITINSAFFRHVFGMRRNIIDRGALLERDGGVALGSGNKAKGDHSEVFQIPGYVKNVGSLVRNDFSLFSCCAAAQTKKLSA